MRFGASTLRSPVVASMWAARSGRSVVSDAKGGVAAQEGAEMAARFSFVAALWLPLLTTRSRPATH